MMDTYLSVLFWSDFVVNQAKEVDKNLAVSRKV